MKTNRASRLIMPGTKVAVTKVAGTKIVRMVISETKAARTKIPGTKMPGTKIAGTKGSNTLEAKDCGKRFMCDGENQSINRDGAGQLLDSQDVEREIESYLESNWENLIADIGSMVSIPSVENLDEAIAAAPFGLGPRAALDEALGIAGRMGFDIHDCEGYIGYADLPGDSEKQVGIIGHVDVVPAGPGWTFDPFALTRKDGYLIGRGTSDDKGPLVVALHAANLWATRAKRLGVRLPYTLRVLFGANEETSMADVAYYRERFADPDFLFTPDAEFPVCYGEAGMFSGLLKSAPIEDGAIKEIAGGVAVNAVPGTATCIVRGDFDALSQAARDFDACGGRISVSKGASASSANLALDAASDASENVVDDAAVNAACGELVRIDVEGKSAHASTPELGASAIRILVDFLLDNVDLAESERAFLELDRAIVSATDGSGVGLQATDDDFGDLTLVGGVMKMEGNCISQTIDSRYPSTSSPERISETIGELAAKIGATMTIVMAKEPFLIDPDAGGVQALLSAYKRVTGETDTEPFTMKGGTYARKFSNAVSFGPEKPWESAPDWVGGMHGANEGVSEDSLKEAFRIYALAIGNLMKLEL